MTEAIPLCRRHLRTDYKPWMMLDPSRETDARIRILNTVVPSPETGRVSFRPLLYKANENLSVNKNVAWMSNVRRPGRGRTAPKFLCLLQNLRQSSVTLLCIAELLHGHVHIFFLSLSSVLQLPVPSDEISWSVTARIFAGRLFQVQKFSVTTGTLRTLVQLTLGVPFKVSSTS